MTAAAAVPSGNAIAVPNDLPAAMIRAIAETLRRDTRLPPRGVAECRAAVHESAALSSQ
jgi:hypothetical protein